ncbi:MAG: hypothetical protein CME70_11190 [Halobacteriovorax sp.]|nr:hypothetical protein [Halobacteriovorax sp.]|tara:strand:+ start:8754 stop:9623 length:870 start_codon:yes stop_codon:yes gene_type:complete
MNLNLLKIFVKVADCGSLSRASKLLNHPKSKISRDLVKLENELEQTLLTRTPRGITLTEQGFMLLQSTRVQLEKLESSIQKIKSHSNEIKGNIKLTAPEDLSIFILTRLISEFMDLYQEVSIELYSTTEFLDFKKNDIDLALRIGRLEDSTLIQRKVTEVDVIFVASNHYIKANSQIKSINDLENNSCAIIKDVHGTPLNKDFHKGLKPKFSSNSMSALKEFVFRDKGIATLPSFLCKKELVTNEFSHVLPKHTYVNRNLYLLSPSTTYTPRHVKIFKDFIFDALKKEL